MSALILLVIGCLSFVVFLVPKSLKYNYALLILSAAIIWSSLPAGSVLLLPESHNYESGFQYISGWQNFNISIDRLSAFFIFVINITVFVGFIYAKGYLRPYYEEKNSLRLSIHYFSYIWLYLSMLMVVMIGEALPFLIAWEIMALSSFFLVIFDAEDTSVMKTGINYLIQMHVGMFFILVAFMITGTETGNYGFDGLRSYFSSHSNFRLFVLFFIGFGIKAGFIPLHTWLPRAHPAAPSHVSGIMSGVMIKMGIYGIFRVLMAVQNNLMEIGLFLLVLSALSGIMGVMMAIVQHDLKKLLAYHSIENIGIIGIGLSLGVIGQAVDNPALTLLGFSGGLLHVLNHSLFKSVLFFNAGSVYQATHTRNIEHLGGLLKKMPQTAALFLIGSLAICGLPPFNGFISEYLIYLGMFKGLTPSGIYLSVTILTAILTLVLIGGLAIFCFTKAFGIVFLGEARTAGALEAREAGREMIWPQYISVLFITAIGLASPLLVKPVFSIITGSFNLSGTELIQLSVVSNLSQISILAGVFVLLVTLLLVYRFLHLRSKVVSYEPTWGCGSTATGPKQQYTATSYAYNFIHLAKPVLQTKKITAEIGETEIFPSERTFISHNDDIFRKYLVDKPVDLISGLLKKIAVMQTGRIQDYILYAFLFLILVLALTWLNVF